MTSREGSDIENWAFVGGFLIMENFEDQNPENLYEF